MSQSRAKILLVDDELSILLTAQEILQREGYSVDTAPDGASAVRALAKNAYDLLLTDLKMEGMDGLELLAHVQRQSPHTVTVMMTGYGSLDIALEAVRNGAYEYLLKPVAAEELKQAVRRSLERKRFSEIDTLYNVSTELARVQTREAIEATVVEAAKKILCLDHVHWFTLDGDGGVRAPERFATKVTRELVRLETGEPVVEVRQLAKEVEFTSSALVPGFSNGRLVGVIFAAYDQVIEFHASALRFLSGLAVQAALAFDNISLIEELRRNNASLAEANRKLKELDVLKSQFLSVATHELRTPLSVVLGYNAMIEETADSRLTEEERGLLRESLSACKRLMRLVNSMLDLSQMQCGKLHLQFSVSDLRQSVESVVALLEAEAQKRGIRLELRIPETLPKVEIDGERIEQVLVNLISNALKFTDREGAVSVELRRADDDLIEIQVRDTGIGIAQEHQAVIFDEFARVRHGKAMGRPGSGLGLAIVRQIVNGHGGDISVNSTPGQGSTFRVKIPISQHVQTAVSA
jgi:signal transduction histidine kinase/CheY-like chemotaxis protein